MLTSPFYFPSQLLRKRVSKKMLTTRQVSDIFLYARKAERISENTLAEYRNTFQKFMIYSGEGSIFSKIDVNTIRGFLASQTTVSDKTLLNYHIGLSALWHFAKDEGIVGENIVRQVKPPKPETRDIIPFSQDEIVSLLLATDRSKAYTRKNKPAVTTTACGNAYRDHAIVLTLLDTGLRATELVDMTVGSITSSYIKVLGKGDKERHVPACDRTLDEIWSFLDRRKGLTKDSLVWVGRRGAKLTRFGLNKMFERLEERTKLEDVHAHRFRHTFAITYLRNKGDIYTLQYILGHSTLDMVKRYLAIAETDVLKAHKMASPVAVWGF